MSKITKIVARQVFDSRGNPTIEAQVYSKNFSIRIACSKEQIYFKNQIYQTIF